MSFIYAKKFGETIAIFSDTKVTFCEEKLDFENEQDLIKSYGIMKCYILNRNCAVAFAGECCDMNDLLPNLLNETDIEKIKDLCFKKHLNYIDAIKDGRYKTDFIIASYQNNNLSLFEIKNGNIIEVEFCWLGSNSAFEEFQSRKEKNDSLNSFNITFENNDNFCDIDNMKSYNKYFDRFYNSVFSCSDRSVGNFVIPLIFNSFKKSFEFKSYVKHESPIKYTLTSIIEESNSVILTNYLLGQDKRNGDYNIFFFGSCNNYVVFYISEIFLAINFTYGRIDLRKTNKEFKYLSIAQSSKMSIYQLLFEMQGYGFTQPPMLPYGNEILKKEILRFFEISKELIKNDFSEAEKIIIFTTNVMFQQYQSIIENNPNEITDFLEFIYFVNNTKWETCELKIHLSKSI